MIISKLKNRIAYRLLFRTLIFSGLVTFVITAVQLKIEYKRDIKNIDEQFFRIENSFKKQIAESLWFFNEKALSLHLEGISNLKDIEYLNLSGDGGVSIIVGQKNSTHTLEKNLPIIYYSENANREIGNLKIIMSLSNVYSRLIDRLIIILISQGIKTFIVAIFIYLLFHFFVIQHLSTIDKYLKRYELGITKENLSLKRKLSSVDNELDQVVNSINEMSNKLKDSYETLEQKVNERTRDLQNALEQVKTLNGLIPICAHCKKIRDDKGYWNQLEKYISDHSDAEFSHGICPGCLNEFYPEDCDEAE